MRALMIVGLLAALAAPATAEDALRRPIWIVNGTDQEIIFLYEAPRCCNIWEEDMLGVNRTLKPGERVRVDLGDFNGECSFTLYATFKDGRRLSGPPINACTTAEFRFEWSNLR